TNDNGEYRTNIEVAAGGFTTVVVPAPLAAAGPVLSEPDATPFFVDVYFVPGIGWSSGELRDRYSGATVETSAGEVRVADQSLTQFYYGLALRFGYEFADMWGIGAEARLQMSPVRPLGGLVGHVRVLDTRYVDL